MFYFFNITHNAMHRCYEWIILDRCGQLPGAVGYIMYTIEPALLYDLCVR